MGFKPHEIITQREMGEELGCHPNTIGAFMNRGELEYVFIGGRRRVLRYQWQHFLESRRATGPLVEVEDHDDE
jgi:hypothetical protein